MKSRITSGRRARVKRKRIAPRALKSLIAPLALPQDASAGEARITLYSDRRAFIENHSGIIEFDDAHVRVAAKRLTLTIRGADLTLDCCEGDALIINGQISCATLEARGGRT